MKQLDRVLSGIENVLAAGTLAVAALISILNVILRQFGQSFFWTEEAVIYLIIFSTFIGAVITMRHNEHVSVDILTVFFKDRGKKVITIIGGLITLTYLGIMSVLGWMLIFEPFSRSVVTPVLKLPLWVVELAVPIGMTLMFLRAIEMLYRAVRYGTEQESPEEIMAAEAEAAGLTVEQVQASHAEISGADDADGASPGSTKPGSTRSTGSDPKEDDR